MNHTRTEHLYPATVLTGTASLPITDRTIYIHLGAWFCEWEVAVTEAHPAPFAEEFAGGSFQGAFEISHSTVFVNKQALDLVEHRLVRSINSFIAVNFPRYDNAHRWSRLLHDANLH